MLTRSIDLDRFGLTIEEKIFRGAKRLCIVFAVGALALSMLDLMNIRSIENATEFFHAGRQRIADLPDRIRTRFQSIARASPSSSAVAVIPRGEIAMTPRSTRSAAADARVTSDAVAIAMTPLPASTQSQPLIVADPALAPGEQAMIFASADLASSPPITPIAASLPTSAAMPLVGPPPAPAAPSPAELLRLEGSAYAKAERCLADAIYFEARGEPVSGQIAVAQVVMNRAFSGFYPNDVCAVVYQNANRHRACQFSFACNGKRKIINERGAWARANRIAKLTLDGKLYVAAVGTSTHFHAVSVHPNWVHEMRKIVRYGIHDFYRPIAWGNGSDEPVWATAALAQNNRK